MVGNLIIKEFAMVYLLFFIYHLQANFLLIFKACGISYCLNCNGVNHCTRCRDGTVLTEDHCIGNEGF